MFHQRLLDYDQRPSTGDYTRYYSKGHPAPISRLTLVICRLGWCAFRHVERDPLAWLLTSLHRPGSSHHSFSQPASALPRPGRPTGGAPRSRRNALCTHPGHRTKTANAGKRTGTKTKWPDRGVDGPRRVPVETGGSPNSRGRTRREPQARTRHCEAPISCQKAG